MVKTRFVKDIKEGEQVRDLFLVAGKAQLMSNAGKPYLTLALRDRTGQFEGRVWDRAEEIGKRFERDDIVEIGGTAIQYQGRMQLKVHDVQKAAGARPDLGDFLPPRDRASLEETAGSRGGRRGRGPAQAPCACLLRFA
ncbi:MAG: HD family phosphohydrolase [Actinobacteria bacterium]|nr:HD family phosphohydrolase [Actinomycetota bacterium]